MAGPARARPEKNIWVAASDGDLERVQELVQSGLSVNIPDPNTYTPMHAAASYGHIHVLEYLIAQGGDVNITDEDGDTPLYTVENVATAQWLVEHGAVINRTNSEGVSPIAHLREDFPEVATYLESTVSTTHTDTTDQSTIANYIPSQHAQNIVTEELTSELMQAVQEIMQRAEAEGRDPEPELRALVGRTVLEGVATGYEMSVDPSQRREEGDDVREREGLHGAKRTRTDEGPGPQP
ncbi:ankyrin repeat-containing domain protein [Irpex rosettiformis]|uniref:Ankyrin repeat-containing domain protein n=1 Tax=Irpex rosettiformis TaxID=378272 RepID=A0ACB8U7C0_9APHY|nr:ankyrin repeat-containing domain protein [Irpex rosettiformis]